MKRWPTRTMVGLAFVAVAMSFWLAYDAHALQSFASARLLLGPFALGHSGWAELEKHHGQLPRLRVVGGRVFDVEALVATYTFFDRVLALRRPFTVIWDPRSIVFPHVSSRLLREIRRWVDTNAVKWDTNVQAHALLLTNPIARSFAQLVVRLFAPPQPVRIVTNEEEALAFHKTCCQQPRSWVKTSYADRDQRFSMFWSRSA
eukprot:CAMPEP_0119307218 /NCGR_PEP_ID=MMETSP1333-20130426/7776_1 /TAXON_ID=418940 /ORGANISM="Scyphosphaera apsteinii, Strain RCC1455" /LENGTH=202 /DNA_ID=CAMNT_0007310711 /DNA_START=87 /DNA_END=695 /DNA_ORIENTATION=+